MPRRRRSAQPLVGLGPEYGDGAALVLGDDDHRVLQLAPSRRCVRLGETVVLYKRHARADKRGRHKRADLRADLRADVGSDW